MNRFALAFCAIAFLAAPLFAEDKPADAPATVVKVDDKDALKAAIDKKASLTVEGTVSDAAWSSSGKVLVIHFEGAQTSQFSSVVFSKNKDKINKAFDDDVIKAIKGAKVQITGPVVEFKSNPEIVIDKPEQLKVIEKAAASDDKKDQKKDKADEKPAEKSDKRD